VRLRGPEVLSRLICKARFLWRAEASSHQASGATCKSFCLRVVGIRLAARAPCIGGRGASAGAMATGGPRACLGYVRCVCRANLTFDKIEKLSHGVSGLESGAEAVHEVSTSGEMAIRELGDRGMASVMCRVGAEDRRAVDRGHD